MGIFGFRQKPLSFLSTNDIVRKTASILLLCLLAFNWVGYRFFTAWLENRSTSALEQRIEQTQYAETDLIEFRIPLNTPYLTGSSGEFERYDGQVEIDGVHYQYVKRKVENGDLVLLCLPNDSKQRLREANNDFFKLVNDIGRPSKGQDNGKTTVAKSFVTECRQEFNNWSLSSPEIISPELHLSEGSYALSGYPSMPDQPPPAI